TVLIAILATVIALVAGLPLALVMGTTAGFLRFNAGSDGYVMVLDPALVTMMLVLGITFTLLTHIPSIVRLSRSSVVNLQKEASKMKKRKIKVLLGQFDVILLATGLLGMLVFTFFIELFRDAGPQDASNLLIFIPLLTLFAFISPFLFLIGCILGFNRLISPALNLLSNFFWKFDWRLLATVTRNLSANIKLMTRTTLLIAVTISFLVALIVLPVSVQQYQQEQLYYSNGSDITMTLPVLSEDQTAKLLASLDGIQGLAVTSVRRGMFESFYSLTGRDEVYFLGIEQDFASIAHWQTYYDDDTLETLVASLFSSPSSHPVIADATTGKLATLDQSYSIQLRTRGPVMITPVNTMTNFPGIAPNWSPGSYYLVCQYDQIIGITGFTRLQLANEIWGKVLPGYEHGEVMKEFRKTVESMGLDGNDVISVIEEMEKLQSQREARLIWQVVNYNFLGGLAIILSVVTLYAFASLSRNIREIGLGRALGLKKHQILLLLLTEPVMLFFMTGIPGGAIGLLLLVGLITLFGPILFWGPPFVLNLSLSTIVMIYSIIFIAMILIGMITSLTAVRSNISQILKVE
ncbi:MAG: FtsX-like permease family protein, partial [Candidatus Odinarchaeota archaeon]